MDNDDWVLSNDQKYFQAMFDKITDKIQAFEILANFNEVSDKEENWRIWIRTKEDLIEFLEVFSNYRGCLNEVGTKIFTEMMIWKGMKSYSLELQQSDENSGEKDN